MEKIKRYYEENNRAGYPDYYILGWESEEAQKRRFKELVGNIDLNNKVILDVGCGTGNLLEYIGTKFHGYNYTGVDVLPHMIERAGQKGLDGEFRCLDLFKDNPYRNKSFDAIFSSGIFNLNLGNNQEFLIKAVEIFQNLSRETVSFNLLWDMSNDRDDKYFYFSPEEVNKNLSELYGQSWDISIVKGYLNNDFTVCLSRES